MTQHLTPDLIARQAQTLQTQASNPGTAVWVAASAGTGKTHMLTQRLLRLLLQNPHLPANRILAITYTKAAAAEMQTRLLADLKRWVYLEETELKQKLDNLLDRPSNSQDVTLARCLYARLLDDPQGVTIATIHSLCEQLLRQFPLEAGLQSGFEILEASDEAGLLAQATHQTLAQAASDPTLHQALVTLAPLASDSSFFNWLIQMTQGDAGRRLQRYLHQFSTLAEAEAALAKALNINPLQPYSLELTIADTPWPLLRDLAQAWASHGTPAEQNKIHDLQKFIEQPTPQNWPLYHSLWLTSKDEPRKSLVTAGVKNRLGEPTFNLLLAEQQRVYQNAWQEAAWRCFITSRALLTLARSCLDIYQKLKQSRGVVDFADLIHFTHQLLHNPQVKDWVAYKLDRRLHHILLDEAQDTDHEQWAILQALTDEFYAGLGQHEAEVRTLFAVGDMKQSIYRFRGAEPEVFAQVKDYLQHKTAQLGLPFTALDLTTSFRSAPGILAFVDAVFADPAWRANLDPRLTAPLHHQAHKLGSGGQVTLWPPQPHNGQPSEELAPWALPQLRPPQPTAATAVYQRLAQQIHTLVNSAAPLGTLGRPAEYGDMLILLRDRRSLGELIAVLNAQQIPHTGADRLNLTDSPLVQDILALGWTLLNPSLDLPLVHTLRGLFFGYDLAALTALKTEQKQSHDPHLWATLNRLNTPLWLAAKTTLSTWRTWASALTPGALFRRIIHDHQGRSRAMQRFGQGHDLGSLAPLEALLNLADSLPGTASLTDFLHQLSQGDFTHKNEPDPTPGRVRVMTIHAAKGLEAPVVFLPDLFTKDSKNQKRQTIHWYTSPHPTGPQQDLALLVTPPGGGLVAEAIQHAKAAQERRQAADEASLLYVAFTRARDQLYLAGVGDDDAGLYQHLKQSLEALGASPLGDALCYRQNLTQSYPSRVSPPESQPQEVAVTAPGPALPETTRYPERASHRRNDNFLTPATPHPGQQLAIDRGVHLHKLLELLPTWAPATRAAQSTQYLALWAAHLPSSLQQAIHQQAWAVFNTYPELFGSNSLGEVALQAEYPDSLFTGSLDRLVLHPDEVWIVDFKSDQQPTPETQAQYQEQLAKYAKAARLIWPTRQIKTALLWTATTPPRLVWLP